MEIAKSIKKYYNQNGVYFTYKDTAIGYQSLKKQMTHIIKNIFVDYGYSAEKINVYFADIDRVYIDIFLKGDIEVNQEILRSLDDFMGLNGIVQSAPEGLQIVYDTSCNSLSQSKLI